MDTKHGTVVLFSWILFIAMFTQGDAQEDKPNVDCRRFVFAPRCRGIAAKRDAPSYEDDMRLLASKISWDFAERNLPDV